MNSDRSRLRFNAAPFVFIGSLLVLAYVGSGNQASYIRQWDLIDYKAELQSLNSTLRQEAAAVSGPTVVGQWARAQGMIPAPQGRNVREVAPEPVPPQAPAPVTGLEVHTVWR